ncbi:MAG: CRISPR-associated endonuclease Cas2 [Candidatus Gottesmanbacteria bacterium]
MGNIKFKKTVLKISEGILESTVDLVLWHIVYLGELGGRQGSWQAMDKAENLLADINYKTIKKAIYNARQKGFIKKSNRRKVIPEITEAGKKRLSSLMPVYDNKRIWDGRLYLVTYDIPETKKNSRDLLREFLRRIGAGLVQESVWITPFTPHDLIREFVNEQKLDGSILISDMGKDGNIGEEDIKDLLNRVYRLDKINDEYQEFINKFEDLEQKPWEIKFSYWRILRKDPQLPFNLLPSYWLGDKAHELYSKLK